MDHEVEGTRDVLLKRVMAYVVQHGVGDTSLRGFAAHADTTHRMLTYHFGSREGLLAAIVAQVWKSQQETVRAFAAAAPDDARANAWRYWTMLADRSGVAPLVFELSARAMHGAPWKEAFVSGLDSFVDQLTAQLVHGGEPEDQAASLSRMYVATMLGALWDLQLNGDRQAANATVRAVLDATWSASP